MMLWPLVFAVVVVVIAGLFALLAIGARQPMADDDVGLKTYYGFTQELDRCGRVAYQMRDELKQLAELLKEYSARRDEVTCNRIGQMRELLELDYQRLEVFLTKALGAQGPNQ